MRREMRSTPRRVIRLTRRAAAILLGLALGWYAAGAAAPLLAGSAVASPPEVAPEVTPNRGPEVAAESSSHAVGHGAVHDDAVHAASHDDAGTLAARNLVPVAPDTHGNTRPTLPRWFAGVLGIAAGLFIAAIVIGLPIVRRSPAPAPQHDH